MRTERCERCQYEDTEVCDDCEVAKTDKIITEGLERIIDREEQRIRGD